MRMDSENLPFVPPVEGCQVEHIHHVGPFVTRVDLRLPDGKPWIWDSRQHRYFAKARVLADQAGNGVEKAEWWSEIGLLVRIFWWVALLFMIGSTCFAVASLAGLMPDLFGAFGESLLALNLVFFIGSIFFTSAAYLQFLGAVNADRVAAIAHRRPPETDFQWFSWRPREIGWLSAFTQFVGTLLFNVNTFDALLPSLGWLREDLLIWTPDALGSICFLIASVLALLEYGQGRWSWRPQDVSWWVVNINLLGSVAFGISAVYALVLPSTGDLLDAGLVNAWTLAGALCFLTGAYLLLPELGRKLTLVIPRVPSE